MEGFSYNNIFDTKGIEYLVIIAFLLSIIPFWIIINKPRIVSRIKRTPGIFPASSLRIPAGLYYSRNHTWAHLEKSGSARVGLDDFLLHVTGEVSLGSLRKPGETIKKGDLLTSIGQKGKILRIFSPVTGTITGSNVELHNNPDALMEDPYGEGWIYTIRPSQWIDDTSKCCLADDAVAWAKKEVERVKEFVTASSGTYSVDNQYAVLQDGGELFDNPLSDLPDEVWQDFQKSFLS
jgi:glycine cleavage system H protein